MKVIIFGVHQVRQQAAEKRAPARHARGGPFDKLVPAVTDGLHAETDEVAGAGQAHRGKRRRRCREERRQATAANPMCTISLVANPAVADSPARAPPASRNQG
ncbi:hypothetical protein GCM10010172_77210 [Paractinoplanes ferrugineus]|uniref:Uncharacterized protein n=1 Tax=Paractinoplanes ferrugineus TaxID=113564 RepID=A0A919MHM6_9ACTN|nr:hypothetical protein [Actinoplanes ferrugineus]GIE12795.1 hypothetical protein Afe05nite_46350 [Actinoplanes ferrugineus]